MMAIRNRQTVLAATLGGAMALGVAVLFLGTHYQALLLPFAAKKAAAIAAPDNPPLMTIPSVDEMCKAAGATAETMASCLNDENAAGEFVIAWMALHGFISSGAIDYAQIELAASLGPDALSPLTDPDPSLSDPNAAEPNFDPATGLPVLETFDSPAQIAMFCLTSSSDWLQLHDCISRYDPSSRFNGGG